MALVVHDWPAGSFESWSQDDLNRGEREMRRRWKGSMVVVMAGWMLACSGSPTVVEIGRLEGSWEWRSATGGIAGRTITPATEGYSMELRFLAGRNHLRFLQFAPSFYPYSPCGTPCYMAHRIQNMFY